MALLSMDKSLIAEKLKAVTRTIASLDKQFGKGTLMAMNDQPYEMVEALPTGSLGLDRALGIGGIPRGRIVEVFGPESSGKTTLALHTIAECQRAGGVCAFVDAEHALDMGYAEALGVDPKRLFIAQPDFGEQALEVVDALVHSGGVDLVVVDSVAALTPKAEIEGDVGDAHVGLQARMMSQALRKVTAAAAREKTCVIFLNQLRQKIGVTYGSNETTTGGNALKFFASVRIDVRRIGGLKDGEENIGNRVRFRVVKNKCAPPFAQAECDVLFGKGISRACELLDLAVEAGVIEKAGAWYSFGPTRLGQGRERVREYLEGDGDLFAAIHGATLQALASRKLAAVAKGAKGAGAAGGGGAIGVESDDEEPLALAA